MYKVLVVDDSPDVRHTVTGILSDEGYVVRGVANEGDALDAVIQDSFDFALIDVRLHSSGEDDESGVSLAMALHALDPRIRIIQLTRYVKTSTLTRALWYLGVVDFVDKSKDWIQQILRIITEFEEKRKSLKRMRVGPQRDATKLSFFLASDRPLMIRGQGSYVFSECTLDMLEVDLDCYIRRTEIARQSPTILRSQVEEIGRDLWHGIFVNHPEAERAYLEARAKGRPLSLLFESTREFLRLPMEFTRSDEPDEYLILQHPLSRFVCGATPKRKAISPQVLARTNELRILLIASNTKPRIDGVDIEIQNLRDHLQSQNYIPVTITFLPTEHATYRRVQTELRKGDYDVIHYAGHGYYEGNSSEESSLYFWAEEDRSGSIVRMKATELKVLLSQSKARLVYLSSSYGTDPSSDALLLEDDFLGLIEAVAQGGVPSVLGFRWSVSDKGARELATNFYRSLLDQGSPEFALWSARCHLAAVDRNNLTWMSPILIHQETGNLQ